MFFPYTLVEYSDSPSKPKVLCPWIPIEISLDSTFASSITALGLLDSGADFSIVDRELGEFIGIDKIERGKSIKLSGIGGGSLRGYLHEIYHRIRNPKRFRDYFVFKGVAAFTAREGFSKTDPQSTAVWGRNPVFANSYITFSDPYEIEIGTRKN